MNTFVTYDPDAGATYVTLSQEPYDRTVTISDLVAVNVTADGEPIGVEFAVPIHRITTEMINRLIDRFPALT